MCASCKAVSVKWATGMLKGLLMRRIHHIETWNVRGLLETGKLHTLEQKIIRQAVDICGLSETIRIVGVTLSNRMQS